VHRTILSFMFTAILPVASIASAAAQDDPDKPRTSALRFETNLAPEDIFNGNRYTGSGAGIKPSPRGEGGRRPGEGNKGHALRTLPAGSSDRDTSLSPVSHSAGRTSCVTPKQHNQPCNCGLPDCEICRDSDDGSPSHELARLFGDKPALHSLRNRPVGWGGLTFSAGGQLRHRHMDERFRLRPQGAVRRDIYELWRFTPYLQVGNDWITGYVQAIDASIFNEDIPKVAIDENRADLLQYYLDINVWDFDGRPVHLRYGRQVLKYGNQRLVSPLPWGNTFRNFEGFRMYYADETWSLDGFAVQPVNGAAGNTFRPRSFDTPDQSAWFSGVYATYKQAPFGTLDLYWLWLAEEQPKLNRQDGRRHTIGARYAGKRPGFSKDPRFSHTWFWDAEGAWQFGEDDFQNGGEDLTVNAGFVTAIAGVTMDRLPWQPTLKGVFWWGSGDDDPADGDINTVTTLFPLGHAHWGLIDNFNGANLLDYSAQFFVKPTKKLTYLAAWHWFDKASRNDAIYNIAGAPLGPQRTDRNIGHELDLVATYAVSPHVTLQMGYFWFWFGDAVDQTALGRPDAQQFYFQTVWEF